MAPATERTARSGREERVLQIIETARAKRRGSATSGSPSRTEPAERRRRR